MATTNPVVLVLSHLQDGDELYNPKNPPHSLQQLYGREWDQIVRDQGWPVSKAGIDAGVLASGGKRLPYDPRNPYDEARGLGWAVFTKDSVIKLPAGGPRPPVDGAPKAPTKKKSKAGLYAAAVGALALAGASKKKPKKEG